MTPRHVAHVITAHRPTEGEGFPIRRPFPSAAAGSVQIAMGAPQSMETTHHAPPQTALGFAVGHAPLLLATTCSNCFPARLFHFG